MLHSALQICHESCLCLYQDVLIFIFEEFLCNLSHLEENYFTMTIKIRSSVIIIIKRALRSFF